MSDSTLVMDHQACFQFKTSFSPCTILQVKHYDLEQLTQQISTTVQRAPNFFLGSPVVIDLEAVSKIDNIDFPRFKQLLLGNNLVPVGVRGGSVEQHTAAVTAGIPLITVGMGNAIPTKESESDTATPAPAKKTAAVKQQPTKIITTPIRSGMSVYAKEADLIVIASVSPGAELMADGNIHVYGALRGRALAGVRGNTQARIFCRSLEAELVAIAGYYLVKEDIQNLPAQESTVQVFLDNEQVKIATV
jgi:septum site-determining protein MinC